MSLSLYSICDAWIYSFVCMHLHTLSCLQKIQIWSCCDWNFWSAIQLDLDLRLYLFSDFIVWILLQLYSWDLQCTVSVGTVAILVPSSWYFVLYVHWCIAFHLYVLWYPFSFWYQFFYLMPNYSFGSDTWCSQVFFQNYHTSVKRE